ncbi:MAG: hypothetical protein R3220_00380 [Balneolaceae bacterium]|nr:hypothetical protein [Balneolaceae bacterium]
MIAKEPVKLFWTGGWDSTFRLLQLLVEERKKVQPFYIIDPVRGSTGVEIQCMDKLKRVIKEKYPHTNQLFLPTSYVNIESIKSDREISYAFERLKKHVPVGSQYEWLARFCKQHNYRSVEFALENVAGGMGRTEGSTLFRRFINNNFSDDPDKLPESQRLIYSTTKILVRYFKFPIIHIHKSEMFTLVKQNGWMPIMEETWFCYQPLYVPFRGLTPCGNCITCSHQVKYGLNWRIPFYVKAFQKTTSFKNRLAGFRSKKLY